MLFQFDFNRFSNHACKTNKHRSFIPDINLYLNSIDYCHEFSAKR